MKKFLFLIKRIKKILGTKVLGIYVLYLVSSLSEMAWRVYLPGYLLTQISNGIHWNMICISLGLFAVTLYFKTYFNGIHKKNLFEYRLNEISALYVLCMKVPVSEIETKDGKKTIEEVLPAVSSGNTTGIEAYLNGIGESVIKIGIMGIYFILLHDMPLWILILFFSFSFLQLPFENYFNKKEMCRLEENRKNTVRQERFRRCYFDENYIKDSRFYSDTPFLQEKSEEYSEKNISYVTERERYRNIRSVQEKILRLIRNGIVCAYLFVSLDTLNLEMIVLFLNIIANLDMVLNEIFTSVSEVKQNTALTEKFVNFVTRYDKNIASGEEFPEIETIKFENVCFSYDGKQTILNDIGFEAKRGEKIAIVGENGVGKTTLVKILMGVIKPTSGTIEINGRREDISEKSNYIKKISVLFQENPIFAFTMKENIACCEKEAIDEERLRDVMEISEFDKICKNLKCGTDTCYSGYYDENGVQLSGGEKQKLYMARMLYKNADVYILDEPTAALDANAEKHVYDIYQNVIRGKLLFFISHRIVSTKFCDKILFLQKDGPCEIGSFNELYEKNSKFRQMYELQKQYYGEA